MNIINKLLLKLYRKGKLLDKQERYSCIRMKYNLHDSFRFNGDNIKMYGDGSITIGEGSYVGENSTIQVAKHHFVNIGKYCAISHNVRIYTTSTIPDNDWAVHEKVKSSKNVTIGDYVWIGANVFINPGITIGDNAVVGANSVITKDIPAYTIVGGVPAKVIRSKKINA